MVFDEAAVRQHVAVDLYDIVALGGGDCLVADHADAEAVILMPDMSERKGRRAAEGLQHSSRAVVRPVVGHEHLVGHDRAGGYGTQHQMQRIGAVVCRYEQCDAEIAFTGVHR